MLADFIINIHSEPPRQVRVVVHNDLRAMRSAATQHDRRSQSPTTNHRQTLGICHRFESVHTDGRRHPLVAIVRLAPPHLGAGMVAHEMAHAAVWLRELAEGAEAPMTCANDEDFCWILGELVRQTTIQLLELDHDLGANW